jgi:hypothetical protein
MGFLPRYIDKIEELALSEQKTPGQIRTFLAYYPSFAVFEQLRKLCFHVDMGAVKQECVKHALRSLPSTALDTLLINIRKADILYGLDEIIVGIFGMKTLKKLFITSDYSRMKWESLNSISSNIEYLTIKYLFCEPQDLSYIFRCASSLKYLDIVVYFEYDPFASPSKHPLTQMHMLHTAIFTVYQRHAIVFEELEPYFRCMPSLNRLEIKTTDISYDVGVWQTVLQTSLQSLTYFTLMINGINLKDTVVSNILASIQNPFWIERQNFNVVIKKVAKSDYDRTITLDSHISCQYPSDSLTIHWWTGPQRELNGNLPVFDKTWGIYLDNSSSSSLQNHYLNNVTHLFVKGLNKNLLELISKHVNCSRIKHLNISSIKNENDRISTLLSLTRNIRCLQMTLNQLFRRQFTSDSIMFLDISANQHIFDENTITKIAKMFPNLRHLTIFTEDLQNVPKLETYLPRLCSLTFCTSTTKLQKNYSNNDQKKSFDRVQFFIQREREHNYITVWIDRAALQDSFWQRNDMTSDPDESQPKKKIRDSNYGNFN